MPTELALADHVEAISDSAQSLRDAAREAGLDAPVPTCPTWDVTELIKHLGMVHRWAAANLRGDRDHRTSDSTAEAAATADLLAWFADGVAALLATIEATPDDAKAMVFLADAPPPRRFWARRQAHETTIHSVDAVSALLGRWPTEADTSISPHIAVDGIDELLCGFVPRRRSRLRSVEPYTVLVMTTDTGHAWTLSISEDPVVTTIGAHDTPDATLSGTACQLYLGLWNRSDEVTATGREDVLANWREQVRVQWS